MSDLISRQAAIDAVEFGITYAKAINKSTGEVKELFKEGNKALNEAVERLKELSSAQPEPKCNSCRYRNLEWYEEPCDSCTGGGESCHYKPERKKGKWIYGEKSGQDGWYCSECGGFIPWYYDFYGLDNIDFIEDFKTCPFCDSKMVSYTGADMRGEQE